MLMLRFENRSTFTIVGREEFGDGIGISILNQTADETWLETDAYLVRVPSTNDDLNCATFMNKTDAVSVTRLKEYPQGTSFFFYSFIINVRLVTAIMD